MDRYNQGTLGYKERSLWRLSAHAAQPGDGPAKVAQVQRDEGYEDLCSTLMYLDHHSLCQRFDSACRYAGGSFTPPLSELVAANCACGRGTRQCSPFRGVSAQLNPPSSSLFVHVGVVALIARDELRGNL